MKDNKICAIFDSIALFKSYVEFAKALETLEKINVQELPSKDDKFRFEMVKFLIYNLSELGLDNEIIRLTKIGHVLKYPSETETGNAGEQPARDS